MLNNRRRLLEVYVRRLRTEGLVSATRRVVNPKKCVYHLIRIARGDVAGRSNFYTASYSRQEEIASCAAILDVGATAVAGAFAEIEHDEPFVQRLKLQYGVMRPESSFGLELGRFKCWYAVARLMRPAVVMETGVHDGLSSVLLLRALWRNGCGTLLSIDLPSTDLPVAASGPGWLVPEDLRSRWELYLGDARKLLPALVHERGPIDVFIHDSDHARSHREFEYRTALANLTRPGLIPTDHDSDPEVLEDLAREATGRHYRVRSSSVNPVEYIGGIRCA